MCFQISSELAERRGARACERGCNLLPKRHRKIKLTAQQGKQKRQNKNGIAREQKTKTTDENLSGTKCDVHPGRGTNRNAETNQCRLALGCIVIWKPQTRSKLRSQIRLRSRPNLVSWSPWHHLRVGAASSYFLCPAKSFLSPALHVSSSIIYLSSFLRLSFSPVSLPPFSPPCAHPRRGARVGHKHFHM